jgi:inorganic triphosphatase YgiF
MAYRSVLDWSVAALREEAYDHADLLSEGLTSLAQQRRKELASLSGTALSFAGVVEDYAKLRARKLPAVQIENRIVNFVSERKSQFSPETVREILPVGSVAVTRSIFEFWRNELEKEAERSIVGQSLADLNRNAQRLGMLFASLMRGCTVLAKQPKFLPDINRNCAGELSARFVDHNARIISGLSRLADSTSAEFKNIYMMVQIQGDEFRRGSLRGPRSVVPQADPGFAILENRSTPSIEREVSR